MTLDLFIRKLSRVGRFVSENLMFEFISCTCRCTVIAVRASELAIEMSRVVSIRGGMVGVTESLGKCAD